MRRMISMLMYFNSQPHEEADDNTVQGWMLHPISTHSLTKRLTPWNHEHGTLLQNFNSQPHEEADGYYGRWSYYRGYFNSQPHEEADAWREEKI